MSERDEELSRESVVMGLRKSSKIVGKIDPVLVEKGTMTILDGETRKMADPSWPEMQVELKTPKDRILIRMHRNYRRQVPRKETQAQIISLINMLELEQVPQDQILSRLSELTPYTEQYLRSLVPSKYKQETKARTQKRPRNPLTSDVHSSPGDPQSKKKVPVCPSCGTELHRVLCPKCLKEIPTN